MFNNKISSSSTAESCPISSRRIDSNLVRVISFQVALISVVLFITQESILAFILLFDFLVRILRIVQLSPFYLIATFTLKVWGIAPKLCDESPKRFALYLGLLISLVVVLLYMAKLYYLATIIISILFVCALLETLFDFCIGCKIYYVIQITKGRLSARNFK